MSLNILFVEDSDDWRRQLIEYFSDENIGDHSLNISVAETFDEGKRKLKEESFDLVVLDLYQGEPEEDNPKTGLEVLEEIQKMVFVPVIFFTGLSKDIASSASEIVGVVNKAQDGLAGLKLRLEEMVSSNLALIKRRISEHVEESLRSYFWDTVHSQNKIFEHGKIDVSLGYLLLRRLSHSLSKEKIKEILGDETIQLDKVHPMEFYIYPSESPEFETGEILVKEDKTFVILTPSCDFVCHGDDPRNADDVLLCSTVLLKDTHAYQRYREKPSSTALKNLIESRKGDRFFFLPGTPFLENLVLDFQQTFRISFAELDGFKRLARLDDPFAQAMVSSFTRYYNRIGYPDIDADYVLNSLESAVS